MRNTLGTVTMNKNEISPEDLPDWYPEYEAKLDELAQAESEKEEGYRWDIYESNKSKQQRYFAVVRQSDERKDEILSLFEEHNILNDAIVVLTYGATVAGWVESGILSSKGAIEVMGAILRWGFITGYEANQGPSALEDLINDMEDLTDDLDI